MHFIEQESSVKYFVSENCQQQNHLINRVIKDIFFFFFLYMFINVIVLLNIIAVSESNILLHCCRFPSKWIYTKLEACNSKKR